MNENKRPDVGVALIVIRDNKVLMCERNSPDGGTWWSFPGGRMEFGESFKETGLREIKEETGLDVEITNKNPIAVTNDILNQDKHYITLFLKAKYLSGEAKIIEPEKFKRWEWIDWNNLPSPLSPQAKNLVNLKIKI